MRKNNNKLFSMKKSVIAGVASVLMMCVAFGVAGCKNNKNSSNDSSSSPDSSVEQVNTYTVTFESNGGSAVNSVTVNEGETVNLSNYIPEKEGYYFYGWSLDAEFTTRANNSFVVGENVTLYAEWGVEEKYLLSFETNGGSAIESVLYYPNAYLAIPENPTKANYVFGGWYKDAALTKEFSFNAAPQMPKKAMTIYAKWNEMNAIVFNSNGGSAVETVYGAIGDPIIGLEEPTKAGYIFDGWYEDAQLTMPYDVSMIPAGIVTVYAKWHEQTTNAQVVLHINYGDLTLTKTITGDEGTILDDEAAIAEFTAAVNAELADAYLGDDSDLVDKPIFKLNAWSYDTNGNNRFNGEIPHEQTTDLYAIWTRSATYCLISFVEEAGTETKYYVKKNTIVDESVLNAHMQSAKDTYEALGCQVDGFYTLGGNSYKAGEKIAMDMRLIPYVYSADLSYAYTTIANANGTETQGYVLTGYDSAKKAEYQAKDELMLLIPEYVDGAQGKLPVIWIADDAFNGFNVSSVTMPANIVGIGARAFQNSELTTIAIPSKVTYLGDNAFSGSTALATVNFDGQISQLGATVFSGTAYEATMPKDTSGTFIFFDDRYEIIYSYIGTAKQVTTPSTARIIGGGAFKNNTTVTKLTIGDSIRHISDYAFEGSALQSVTVGKFFASMGVGIFKNCASLASVNFTSKYHLASFGESMFEGCVALKEINISEISSLKEFKDKAFFGCSSLEKVQVSNNFLKVGASAFEGCTSLVTVDFGTDENAQVNTIGARAFADCTALKKVILRGNLFANNQIVTFKAGVFASSTSAKVAPILYVKDTVVDNYYGDDENRGYTYVEIYQMRLPTEYKNMDIRAIDAKEPEVVTTPVQMTANSSVDLLSYLLAEGAVMVSDNVSSAEDCIISIMAVAHETSGEIFAVGGKYNMSQKGAYIVVVAVEDEFGNVAQAQISVNVI